MASAIQHGHLTFSECRAELLSDDCKHRTGFTHINSDLIKRNPDDSTIAHVHELECLTCGNTWRFAQKSLPAREHQNR